MAITKLIEKLAVETNNPCVTISLNTYRTFPDNQKDMVRITNLAKEAEERILNEYEKRDVLPLLSKLESLEKEIDVNYNLDSLHIFVSNDTCEIIKSVWPVTENSVQISDTFSLRHLIHEMNRSEEYYILLLSLGGVHLYHTTNDSVHNEIRNEDFPFTETRHYHSTGDKSSDPKLVDNMIREYFNVVDKAVVKIHRETGLKTVVICDKNNYSLLLQVADQPNIYNGFVPLNQSKVAQHELGEQGWEVIQKIQKQRKSASISEMKVAVSQGLVLTDLQEIYRAAIDGRGDLLIAKNDFSQAVEMIDDRSFNFVEDSKQEGAIDDITGKIAWEVMSKKGRVVFTNNEDIEELGDIALKVRY